MCVLVLWLCNVCMCLWPCVYGGCVCLRGYMHVCECVPLCSDCVVFVCVPGHVFMVIVCVRVGVCMLMIVCGCAL